MLFTCFTSTGYHIQPPKAQPESLSPFISSLSTRAIYYTYFSQCHATQTHLMLHLTFNCRYHQSPPWGEERNHLINIPENNHPRRISSLATFFLNQLRGITTSVAVIYTSSDKTFNLIRMMRILNQQLPRPPRETRCDPIFHWFNRYINWPPLATTTPSPAIHLFHFIHESIHSTKTTFRQNHVITVTLRCLKVTPGLAGWVGLASKRQRHDHMALK